ncbi:MAG: beta-galactosidase trimerization domain-containing protein, partial [Clostridia bacterium]|nr:beta-galactosidase trimerization domain-containing protein [Clostridia bacterium]
VLSSAGRPYRISEEIKWASDDLAKCSDFLNGSRANSRIALHYSSNSFNVFRFAPIRENLDYRSTLIDEFYSKLRHHNPDVIDTGHTLDGYDVVISPFLAYAQENNLKERVLAWVEQGGRWIVGPMTDIMDENAAKYTTAPFSYLEEAAGVYTKYQNPLPCEDLAAKWADGSACGVSFYADAFEVKDAEVLATYTDCEFDGLAAITRRKVGKGEIILLGAVPDKEALLRLIGKAPVAVASDNVSLVQRHGEENGIIALEMEHKDGYVELNKPYYDILGERTVSGRVELKPYQALFLREI